MKTDAFFVFQAKNRVKCKAVWIIISIFAILTSSADCIVSSADINFKIMETYNQSPMPPKPNNYMALAILTTIFCCLPFGIVGIVKASKVNSLYMLKQYDLAMQASADAKKWSIIGIVAGLVVGIAYAALTLIYGAALYSL